MAPTFPNSKSRQVEALLDSGDRNPLVDFLRQETRTHVESTGSNPSSYDIFAIRRNAQFGDEIFGPTKLIVGTYSDEALYGAAGSPLVGFRLALQSVLVRSTRAASLDDEELEYGHEAALVWTELGRLKDFMGTSPVISEIAAEFRTARFQFIGKDTPKPVLRAVASALALISEAKRFDSSLVDRVVDILESGGIDSHAQDALRKFNG